MNFAEQTQFAPWSSVAQARNPRLALNLWILRNETSWSPKELIPADENAMPLQRKHKVILPNKANSSSSS